MAEALRIVARCTTVTAVMPVRIIDLVAPLPHKGTDMRKSETGRRRAARSGAVAALIG